MDRKIFLLIVMVVAAVTAGESRAQDAALKTNVVSDILANINIGTEIGLAPKWTLDISGEFNGWTFSHDRRWKHWLIQPEARYWLCDRFSGHFFGAELHGGQYNIGGFNGKWNLLGTNARKLKDTRYQGWFAGAGITYGYAWILGRHWNLEAEIGIGYSYTRYDRYRCAGCGKKIESDRPHHYVGPTKAAVNIVYLF